MGRPDEAAHVLGKLLVAFGPERILWGTDSIWYGSPQDQIAAFRAFEITPAFQEQFGYPALSPDHQAQDPRRQRDRAVRHHAADDAVPAPPNRPAGAPRTAPTARCPGATSWPRSSTSTRGCGPRAAADPLPSAPGVIEPTVHGRCNPNGRPDAAVGGVAGADRGSHRRTGRAGGPAAAHRTGGTDVLVRTAPPHSTPMWCRRLHPDGVNGVRRVGPALSGRRPLVRCARCAC